MYREIAAGRGERSIVQLVPGAPPQVNGVGDHAFTVARALRSRWGIDSKFLVCNPAWQGPESIDGFPLTALPSRRAGDLLEMLSANCGNREPFAAVLLQLSPYGYDSTGCPLWLWRGLRRWKAAGAGRYRLFTYFHELYAWSMPWKRAFWMSPLQRICVRAIARTSDLLFTNLERNAQELSGWVSAEGRATQSIAIPSSVGELTDVTDFRQRARRLVIWGSAAARSDVYCRHRRAVEEAVVALAIECIADIGPPTDHTPRTLSGIPVDAMGVLPANELSALLARSALGVLTYDPNCLAKSGVFAAFCAHGVPAVVLPACHSRILRLDGLHEGMHYLTSVSAGNVVDRIGQLAEISAAARIWYESHSSDQHANKLARALGFVQPEPA